MRTISLCVVVLVLVSQYVHSDQIIILGKDHELLTEVVELQKGDEISTDAKNKIIEALSSEYDEIRVRAMQVIINHKLKETWSDYRPDLKKGTSAKLVKIIDTLFKSKKLKEGTLAEILSEDLDSLLPKSSDKRKVYPKNGDVPLDIAVLDCVVIDEIKRDKDEDNSNARKKLEKFQLTNKHQDMLNNKILVKKDKTDQERIGDIKNRAPRIKKKKDDAKSEKKQ